MIENKEYFVHDDSTPLKRGTRFLDEHKPTEKTLRDFNDSKVHKTPVDRAKEDSASVSVNDLNGHVVAATNDQAKANQAKKTDRTLVVQPSQLPNTSTNDGIVIDSEEGNDYTGETLSVTIDSDTTKNVYLVSLATGLKSWLATITASIDTLITGLASLVSIVNSNTVAIGQNTAEIEGLTGQPAGNNVPVGSVMQWLVSGIPTGYLPLRGQVLEQAEYPVLFGILGSTYNVSDEIIGGQFQLPDLSNKYTSGSPDSESIGSQFGSNSAYIDYGHMPRHKHTFDVTSSFDGDHVHKFDGSGDNSPLDHNGQYILGRQNKDEPFTATGGMQSSGSHDHRVSGSTSYAPETQQSFDKRPLTFVTEMIMRVL